MRRERDKGRKGHRNAQVWLRLLLTVPLKVSCPRTDAECRSSVSLPSGGVIGPADAIEEPPALLRP